MKFRREMEIFGRDFWLISFQEDFNPWLGEKLYQKDHTLQKQDSGQETPTMSLRTRGKHGGGGIHHQQPFCLHSQEENHIPWESGSIMWLTSTNELRQQWSGRSSSGVLFFSGLTFPLPLWPACFREAGPATRGEWDNTMTAQPPWGISLCSLRHWDMKALRRIRRRTQKDKRWTKGNCVTKVHISEPGERSQECQMLKAMEPEKTMWALLILYRAHSAEVGVKVRRQGLVSVQMHGNENSDAENYLKTFRASES